MNRLKAEIKHNTDTTLLTHVLYCLFNDLRMVGTGDAVLGVGLLKQTCVQLIHKLPSLIR